MKIKKLLTILSVLLLAPMAMQASTEVDGLYYDLNNSSMTASVTYRDGYNSSNSNEINYSQESITIPTTISVNNQEYTVTSISSYAFRKCSNLATINIEAPIRSIGDYAFRDCSQLASINIPDGVTQIPDYCFYNCSSLTQLTLPANVYGIGNSAFYGCRQLASINIPERVTQIPGSCFQNCSSLTQLTLPANVKKIGSDAFGYCTKLTSINIPNGVTEIPPRCFYSCESLTKLDLPSNVNKIGYSAFRGCKKLESINIPDGVTEIDSECFGYCSSLKQLTLPAKVNKISDSAFRNCLKLSSINIPNGVREIPQFCFWACGSLTKLDLPETVNKIGDRAFYDCEKLESINIPNGVTEIPYVCFYNCSSLTQLTLPANVNKIGGRAFYGCEKLESINIPDGVTEIPYDCFYNCSSLTQLTLPANVNKIGDRAFYGCSLTELTCLNPKPASCYDSSVFDSNLKDNGVLYVPAESVGTYKAADVWKDFKNINPIGSNLTSSAILNIEDFEINANETKNISVNLDGKALEYAGFQFDITLPEGISASDIKLNDALLADGFTLNTREGESNKIRVISANTTGKRSSLTEAILTLTVTAAADAPDGDAQLTLTNVYMSSSLGEDIPLEESQTTVTINNKPVTGFEITPDDEQSIYVGQSCTFSATVLPENATNKNFTWTLDEDSEGIVEIEANENGEITVKGLALGEATLTATAEDYMGVTATATVKVIPTPAQSVVVSAENLILLEGTTGMLEATVSPEDTTDKTIIWSSDKEDIATVNQDGTVTAIKDGVAVITAKCGDVSGTCTVTVKAIQSVVVNPGDGSSEGDEDNTNPAEDTKDGMAVYGNDLTLRVGQTGTVSLAIEPGIDYDPELEWTLAMGGDTFVDLSTDESDSTTATFEGLVVGTTTYTVSTPANSQPVVSGTITVIAENPVTSLTLTPQEVSLAKNALPYQLTATISPENVTMPDLDWTSSQEGIATVDTEGKVTPVSEGECDITVSTTDGTGLSAVCHVTITAPVDGNFKFEFDESVMGGAEGIEIYIGSEYKFVPKAQDGYVLPDNITWSSSDASTVSVDDDGTVHGLQLGNATIIASATVNGQPVASTCDVTVIAVPAASISIDGGGVTSIKRKETLELIATVLPSNTTYPAVTWTSSSEQTATVSSEGVVTGQTPGNVTITAYVTAYPEVKATFELEITDLLLGDSNDNGIVTVADVVTTANHIISLPVASWSFVNADVTGDNEITTADVTGTVEIILNDVDFASARRARAYSAEYTTDRLVIDNYTSGQTNATIGVRLDGSKPYSALQATLKVPEGLKVTEISAGPALSDHLVLHNEPVPGMVKIIIFSLYNTEFNGDDLPLFYINANTQLANGNLEMIDILGSDADSNEYELSYTGGLLNNILTGIDDVTGPGVVVRAFSHGIEVINAQGQEINIYRYTGETVASVRASEPVERIQLEPGMYVVKAANVAAKVLVK